MGIVLLLSLVSQANILGEEGEESLVIIQIGEIFGFISALSTGDLTTALISDIRTNHSVYSDLWYYNNVICAITAINCNV